MTRDCFKEMILLQDKANKEIVGDNWVDYNINWVTPIIAETVEAIESFSPYHWKGSADNSLVNSNSYSEWLKGQELDEENLQVEVVDIFHFLLSYLIQNKPTIKEGLTRFVTNRLAEVRAEAINKEKAIKELHTFIHKVSDLALSKPRSVSKRTLIKRIVEQFAVVMASTNVSPELLFKLYIGKNRLNVFRTNNGYKVGEYSKNWGEQTDNQVMFSYVKENSMNEVVNGLANFLEVEYQKVKANSLAENRTESEL